MTKLCVPITANTCEGMVREARAAIAAGADMIELRLDYLDLNQDFSNWFTALVSLQSLKDRIIITCRIAEEGGHYRGEEIKRAELLAMVWQAFQFESYIDIERARWPDFPKFSDLKVLSGPRPDDIRVQMILAHMDHRGEPRPVLQKSPHQPRLILSRHDFQKTPDYLSGLLGEVADQSCDVIKIAAKANSILDSVRILDALHEWAARKPTIALSMGETGIITRVLAKKFGAFLTFASLEEGKESAPGQPTLAQMKNLYRWDKLSEKTQVYGVVGCPVAHSMSPAIMNASFDHVSHDGVYLPLRVEPAYEDFKAFLDAFLSRPWLDLRGLSVTIPHKENLLRFVREHGGTIEPLGQRIGVANTLVIEPSQSPQRQQGISAYNTDYRGALDALCAGMECKPEELKKYTFAILGAGGAARAIVAGLRDLDCKVAIYNRSADKAQAWADDFGASAQPWEKRINIEGEVAINCTSVGMWPDMEKTPLPHTGLSADLTVFDTIANPIETRLLREAREHGCRTISGVSMFVNQAAAQFEVWTGKPAPKELMREVVMSRTGKSC